MTRSKIREHIFKLLFRVEFNEMTDMPLQVRLYFDAPVSDEEEAMQVISEKDETYITEKYDTIVALIPEIDQRIDQAAKGRKASRLSKVDLTILRLAVYEMIYDEDIPVSVAIDEAVELAKRFGQDGSASFVNGILANLAK